MKTSTVCYGGYFEASCQFGVCGHATCRYGGTFSTGGCFGVCGVAQLCYGVCGIANCLYPVSGNGAYHDSTSSYYMKYKEPVCITECLKKNPLRVYEYIWEDSNQKGFDKFISPLAEDYQRTFRLTRDNNGFYEMGGTALGLGIELLDRIEQIEDRLNKMEAN
ncbi:MAG TPA: hypothetical protein VMZ04_03755 [Anaerolineae bacterium]|nr:hypothetical protein [Anaerolineae bacterium]